MSEELPELPPMSPVPSMRLDQFDEGELAVSELACRNYARLYARQAVLLERESRAEAWERAHGFDKFGVARYIRTGELP